MPPLFSEEEMDAMDLGDDSEDGPLSKKMLEEICDGSKSHLSVKRREACHKIHDHIKKRQMERKG